GSLREGGAYELDRGLRGVVLGRVETRPTAAERPPLSVGRVQDRPGERTRGQLREGRRHGFSDAKPSGGRAGRPIYRCDPPGPRDDGLDGSGGHALGKREGGGTQGKSPSLLCRAHAGARRRSSRLLRLV